MRNYLFPLLHKYLDHAEKKGKTRMTKRLRELIGEKESLHKGLFSRAKDAMAAHFKRMDDATPTLGRSSEHPQPKHIVKKMPNLGQKPSEDGGPDYTKAMLAGIVGGVVAGPVGAGVGLGYGLKKFRKQK